MVRKDFAQLRPLKKDSSPELYPAGNSDGNWSNLSSVLAAFLLIDLATFDRKRG